MIKIEHIDIHGWETAIRGMRNPMNSWEKSDSTFFEWDDTAKYECTIKDINNNHKTISVDDLDPALVDWDVSIGDNDLALMKKLAKAGSEHSKYRRMIVVWVDITAPLYWWKEFDTYKVGTVANSCSTMHKIHAKEFEIEDFSTEHLKDCESVGSAEFYGFPCGRQYTPMDSLNDTIKMLNFWRDIYLKDKNKSSWWQLIQLLPSSYNQKRTVMLNYENLAHIYKQRKDHKLDEWRELCKWIETLSYSELITLEVEE